MKLINLSKAISLPKFVLLIMERKEKKKGKRKKKSLVTVEKTIYPSLTFV